MKRFGGTIALGAVLATSVLAEAPTPRKQATDSQAVAQQSESSAPGQQQPPFQLPRRDVLLQAGITFKPASREPFQVVARDGKLHIGILVGDVLVPMVGGGASGCFSTDLPARIEKLRDAVEAFPPKTR